MFYRIKDLELYYENYGHGKPVFIICGRDHKLMKEILEPLFDNISGYRRIYIDCPGTGNTKAVEWIKTSENTLYILAEFINGIVSGENFILIGSSYGAYLSRGILSVMKERVDGIIFNYPLIIPEWNKRNREEHKILTEDKDLKKELIPEEIEELDTFVLQSRDIWKRNLSGKPSFIDSEFFARLKANGYGFSFDVDEKVGVFNKPGLILLGKQDSIVGYKDALKLIENYPRTSVVILDCAGHNIEIEQEKIFKDMVTNFFLRVENT